MKNVLDVAAYIVHKKPDITTMKLQKLVYYVQAWSLVWREEPMFTQRIEAWANGPVIPVLYNAHKGQFKISHVEGGDLNRLEGEDYEVIDAVLAYYGDKSSQWLSDLTHMEQPWQIARHGLKDDERGSREITLDSMHEYYEGLSKQ